MQPIVLETQAVDGKRLQAIFVPDKGMNMISFKKGEVEVIEQSTKALFDERYAGLGALIGPHFHRRRAESAPPVPNESLFPHIARIKAKGISDPFSHGIARYAPWKVESADSQKFKATLSGKDIWNEIALSTLEGQNFKIEFTGELKQTGLYLHLAIVSDTDSLVGIHYYYALPNGKGRIISEVNNQFRDQKGDMQTISPEWSFDSQNRLVFELDQEADFTFRPHANPLEAIILLETETYALRTHYQCACEENCWQLYHPAGAKFVCIEPISSQDPKHPNLSVSALDIHLEII